MKKELGTDKIMIDPNTGQRFIYVGADKSETTPDAIIAYSPSDMNGRAVLLADGSVQTMSAEKFQEAVQRDAALPRSQVPANEPVTAPQAAFANTAPTAPMPASAQPATAGDARRRLPMPHGGAMGGGGIGGAAPVVAQPPAKPTAAGVRPIRIEVPRTGQAFTFTKVLNAGQEPLTASFSIMRLKVYRGVQMVMQVCAFVLGLLMLWLLFAAPRSAAACG